MSASSWSANDTAPSAPTPKRPQPAKHKVRHRKVKQGETIYKGHPSWNMMLNIKLGVSYSVGRIASDRNRELTKKDFKTAFKQEFPPEGSPLTPGHSAEHFRFKDHAPFAFRHLREHFGVDTQEYMVSICGEHSLRELGTPGKSGAVFYLTEDGKFIIKTVSKKESKFLRQILPNYYKYVMESGEDTLIPRFLGLIRIKTRMGRNIRLVVMNNLMPHKHLIHKKYDIKGSTLGRWATEEEKRSPHVTLKDLDLKHELALPPRMLDKFQKQINDDCGWLRSLGIMDYSLLMLMHFKGQAGGTEADAEYEDSDSHRDGYSSGGGGRGSHRPAALSTEARGAGSAMRFTQAASNVEDVSRSDDSPAGSPSLPPSMPASWSVPAMVEGAAAGAASVAAAPSVGVEVSRVSRRSRFRLPGKGAARRSEDGDSDSDDEAPAGLVGASLSNLPRLNDADLAQAFARSRASSASRSLAVGGEAGLFSAEGALHATLWEPEHRGQEVMIFGGIIDILQQYGARKQLEHGYKSIRYHDEKEGISVTDPAHYAARFSKFILSKFMADPTKGAAPVESSLSARMAAAGLAEEGEEPGALYSTAAAAAAPAPAATPQLPRPSLFAEI